MAKRAFRPVEYIYLDSPGIESLYAQVVEFVETSRTTTTQKGLAAKAGAKAGWKNFLVKLVSGLDAEASLEVSGSGSWTEQSTQIQTIEHKLERVIRFLSESGDVSLFTNLDEAMRSLKAESGPVFINIRDRFNAPQFFGGGVGVDTVNACGYLLLEKGGAADYCYGDEYYKRSNAIVRVSASIQKMRSGGALGVTSHEAMFMRGFAGRDVPLSIFGTLSGTADYMQIKPYAIWK